MERMFPPNEHIVTISLLYPYDRWEEKIPRKYYDNFLNDLVPIYGGDFLFMTTNGDYIIRSDVAHIILPIAMKHFLNAYEKMWWVNMPDY